MKTATTTIITDITEALRIFADEQVMGLDLETGGLSFVHDPIAVVSLYGEQSQQTAILHVQGNLSPALVAFLSSPRLFITCNGGAFDIPFMAAAGVDVRTPTWYDTLIAEALVLSSARKDLRVSLKASIKRRLGIELLKDQGTSTWMAGRLTPEQLRYCREDVMYLPRLRAAQMKAMGQEQLRALEYEHRLLPVIVQMTMRGLPFDQSLLLETMTHFEDQKTWARDYIDRVLGPINVLSPVQVVNSIQDALDYRLASTSFEAVQAMSEEPGEVGMVGKALTTFKLIMAKDQNIDTFWSEQHVFNGRIYPRYRQVDREYGKLTMSDPNLESLGLEYRGLVGGTPDHTVLGATFGNLWWAVMAHLSRDPGMTELVETNLAPAVHRAMYPKVVAMDDEDVRVAAALIRSTLFGHPLSKFERQLSVFGMHYTQDEAAAERARFLQTFPGLAKLHAQAKMQAALPACPITFPTGMRRVLAKAQPYEITSLRAKGVVAAVVKEAVLQLAEAGLDHHLHAVVGEELVFIIQNTLAKEASREIELCLGASVRQVVGVTLPIRLRAGSHWQ